MEVYGKSICKLILLIYSVSMLYSLKMQVDIRHSESDKTRRLCSCILTSVEREVVVGKGPGSGGLPGIGRIEGRGLLAAGRGEGVGAQGVEQQGRGGGGRASEGG